MHISSKNDFFCKKAQTHEMLSSALQKTVHFIRKNTFSCSWALLLKLHLATFSDWERSFWASVASHSHICLVALNTELVFLEGSKRSDFVHLSSKMNFFCKKAHHSWKCCPSALQRNIHFIRKKHVSCMLSFALKIAFSYLFWLRKKLLSICGLTFS